MFDKTSAYFAFKPFVSWINYFSLNTHIMDTCFFLWTSVFFSNFGYGRVSFSIFLSFISMTIWSYGCVQGFFVRFVLFQLEKISVYHMTFFFFFVYLFCQSFYFLLPLTHFSIEIALNIDYLFKFLSFSTLNLHFLFVCHFSCYEEKVKITMPNGLFE